MSHNSEPPYIKHFQSISDLWRNGIVAQHRIKHIKDDIAAEHTKILNPIQSHHPSILGEINSLLAFY
jgi:hypothetical protein